MPHALTDRQREYLDFIINFIKVNESSPRLEEIAKHFKVKSPSVHTMLGKLQKKGFLYFGRDSHSGFFIRLIERAGTAELVTEIVIAGKIDKYGHVYDFPEKHGHFASVLVGSKADELFGLVSMADLPQVGILRGDLIIFDYGKKPQPNDIALIPFGESWLLVRIASRAFDDFIRSVEMAQDYPIPEKLSNKERNQLLNWTPLVYEDSNQEYFLTIAKEQNIRMGPLPKKLIVATALRLSRQLAFN